ncbi:MULTISPECIES: hypothetical protein [unclassified Agrococcus]|uniref:hypothetical protein n=1 Tax=unclassified Agrococcus TaxID=2615065 RepID=UPI003606EEA9
MSTAGDVRTIRERSMERMRAECDPERAAAYALAGLWDAVELLSRAIEADGDADRVARAQLQRLVRSLPVRLAAVDRDAYATAAVTEHLAEVLAMPSREHGLGPASGRRRRCGA